MTNTTFFRLVATVAVFCCLGCAPKTSLQTTVYGLSPQPESPEAQAIYNYLAYRTFLQKQDTARAIEALENALKVTDSPELYLELANLYWQASRHAESHLVLRKALERYPDAHHILLTLAKTYAAQNRFDDAVLTIDEYRKTHPEKIELIHETAAYRIEQGQFGDAVDRLVLVPASQKTPVTDFLLGKANVGLGLRDRGIHHFRLAVEQDPEFFDAWVEMALTYEAMKNYIEAERVFAHLFDSGSENPQIVFRLVDLNLKLNNPDRALEYIPDPFADATLALEAANLFLQHKFYDHAARLLDPFAVQDPVLPDALFYLAILAYEGRGELREARDYLEAIPEKHPFHERSLLFRVHIHFQQNEKDAARKLCEQSMRQFPNQLEFQLLLAELYELDQHFDQSLEVLRQAAEIWPKNTTISYRMGVLHEKNGDRRRALECMEKTITKDPEHADALNYLGYTLAEEGRDLERAEVLIETAVQLKPDNGYFIDSLAWVYYKRNKFRQAWAEISRAVQLVDSDPTIWEHYGDIAMAMSLPREARKGYQNSVRLNGSNAKTVQHKLDALGPKR